MTETQPGFLIVQTLSARSTYPVANSVIQIYANDESGRVLVASGMTDSSGRSKKFALPAVPKSATQKPGDYQAYPSYDLEISHPGFLPVRTEGIVLYENITSLENVQMMPLTVAPPNTDQIDYNIPKNLGL